MSAGTLEQAEDFTRAAPDSLTWKNLAQVAGHSGAAGACNACPRRTTATRRRVHWRQPMGTGRSSEAIYTRGHP